MKHKSFFEKYCEQETFNDKRTISKEEPIDVIIPLINTNPLFEKNLHSFYREIPINRLIIGNGGCTDNSIEIVKKFPRVKVIDQTKYRSQGYCIAELISHVETEWFIYLHADVYLPENWYENMKQHQKDYDWFECDRKMVVLIEHTNPNLKLSKRALSGSQMGRKKAFENIIPIIEDDFLQRNEDMIFHELVIKEGFKYGRVFDTFHYHQIMNKKGEKEPRIEKVSVQKSLDKEWEIKIYNMQVKGIIKYLQPKPYLLNNINTSLNILQKHNALDIEDFKKWVYNTNKSWLKYIGIEDPPYLIILKKITNRLKLIQNKIFRVKVYE